jgi:signal transduction histidine kinase
MNNGPFRDVYNDLRLIDADGDEQVRVNRTGITSTDDLVSRVGQNEYEQPRSTDATYYSPVWVDEASGEPLMTIAIPLRPLRSVEFSGVLVADIRFSSVQGLIRGLQIGDNQNIYVVTANAQVVAYEDRSLVSDETFVDLAPGQGQVMGLLGNDVVYATGTINFGELDMAVVAETPSSVALQSARQGLVITAIVTVITLVLAVGAITFMAFQAVRPIEELSTVAQSISDENLSVRAKVGRQDEIGVLARSFNDMTDRLQANLTYLEAQAKELSEKNKALRVATAKAKEAARIKGEFLATMSHELRTPLNAIIGFSDMLLMGMSGDLNEQQDHKIRRLQENGKRLLDLVNDILDVTRIEAGRVDIIQEPFSPANVAQSLSAQMAVLAEQSNLSFETRVDSNLPETLIGDPKRIEQVVVNLLSNAFKFTEEGSVILEMKPQAFNRTWTISVIDTGVGIPPHALEFIFDEFRQLDGSSKRAFSGSGLGLAITRHLARMMEGKVTVQSTLGEGSTFTVTLPLVTATEIESAQIEIVGV